MVFVVQLFAEFRKRPGEKSLSNFVSSMVTFGGDTPIVRLMTTPCDAGLTELFSCLADSRNPTPQTNWTSTGLQRVRKLRAQLNAQTCCLYETWYAEVVLLVILRCVSVITLA